MEHLRADVLRLVGEFPETRMLVYPEFHTCHADGSRTERESQYQQMAQPLNGPRMEALRDIAREAGVWLLPGTVVERGPEGELFNTAVVLSPDGELAASYRKIFPWRPTEPFHPGDAFTTFDIPEVGRVGLAICYDLWFPEVVRHLAWLGAEVVVIPTQTTTSDREQELVLARRPPSTTRSTSSASTHPTPSGPGEASPWTPRAWSAARRSAGPPPC
ncbi:carbon-nitrogen hydrolase family protein [Pseudonocardia nigra]|uniref:carbon-nitrogen hydrolase family protein n=1 Tax=Pseudonocardia nigra TaxID=1921578 RepID=UPI001C5F40D0|nr:carbon-nitrogen hydrolase family protein [Pseudonocardia nigra]